MWILGGCSAVHVLPTLLHSLVFKTMERTSKWRHLSASHTVALKFTVADRVLRHSVASVFSPWPQHLSFRATCGRLLAHLSLTYHKAHRPSSGLGHVMTFYAAFQNASVAKWTFSPVLNYLVRILRISTGKRHNERGIKANKAFAITIKWFDAVGFGN